MNKANHFLSRLVFGKPARPTTQELIERESLVGGALFESLPGVRRQFYYMNNHDWFYVATSKGITGSPVRTVIRYHVQPNGVVKSIDGKGHEFLTGDERETFYAATKRYYETVKRELYAA